MSHSLRPLFVNVTWSAGGSTSAKSLALAELTQRQLGLTTCLHITATNTTISAINDALEQAKHIGVRNLLVLRGDPVREPNEANDHHAYTAMNEVNSNTLFTHAADLVRYIRKLYGDYFCIGVAGYPEGHVETSEDATQDSTNDIQHLVEKVQAGADFIMTQLFYDIEAYIAFEKHCKEHSSGALASIPIIPGLMPIQSYQTLQRTSRLSHARVPEEVLQRLGPISGDDEAVKRLGVEILCEMVERIKILPNNGMARGLHFYTLNLEKTVAQILEECSLIPNSTPSASAIVDDSAVADEDSEGFLVIKQSDANKIRRSSGETHNRVIRDRSRRPSSNAAAYEATEIEAGRFSFSSTQPESRAATLAISEGEGSLGREATWDDFPNGRWGDARSPAYGEIDGYGISLHMSPASAVRLWGSPTKIQAISSIFERYVTGQISAIPWSEQSLSPETDVVRDQLAALNRKGWWTIASQPAVNCARSSDPVFGWGPENGFVFQKAFVEFFVSSQDWQRLKGQLVKDEQFTYFAANAAGEIQATDEDSVNPVTWGSFPSKEIVSPTIIESMSFKAWAEEAFGIWKEWSKVYRSGSETNKFIDQVISDIWLVNVIHHDYVEPDILWKTLLNT